MNQHQLAADELAAQGAQAAAVLGGDADRLVVPETVSLEAEKRGKPAENAPGVRSGRHRLCRD